MMAMKSSLSGVFLLLFSISVPGLGSVVWRNYGYFEHYFTWTQAQSFCRSNPYFMDLAVYFSQADVDRTYFSDYSAWIGLHKVNDAWTWTTEEVLETSQHGPYETHSTQTCAMYSFRHKRFYGRNCEASYFVICQYLEDRGKHPRLRYGFISQTMTWSDARMFCNRHSKELAVFSDPSTLSSEIEKEDFPAWIGLHRNGGTWEQSTGLSEYRFWGPNGVNDDCVAFTSVTKDMTTRDCSSKLPFVCYRDNLVLVKENKTWEDALEHCRNMGSSNINLRYELVSVQPGDDHSFMVVRIMDSDTEEVWTGLRFMEGHWWWVNRADMLYDMPVCPVEWQHCGALSKNDTVSMKSRDCLEKKNFLCYRR